MVPSPQESEVVSVLLRLADEQPAHLLGSSDPSAVLCDHLRMQRDSLEISDLHRKYVGERAGRGVTHKNKRVSVLAVLL